MATEAPFWNLEAIYPDRGTEYSRDLDRLQSETKELQENAKRVETAKSKSEAILAFVESWNRVGDLYEEMGAFAYAKFSVDTGDGESTKRLNRIEEFGLPLRDALTLFRKAFFSLSPEDRSSVMDGEQLEPYRFFLSEQLRLAEHQMTPELENLAADLSRSGADAWTRLQESIASTLSTIWDVDTGERKTVNELRAMAFARDRATRERAYNLELEAWKSVEIPMAYSLNGVKGSATVLTKRRSYSDSKAPALLQARITDVTLDSLIGAMQASLEGFRDYFRKKAKLIDVERLRFYDLFAPVGDSKLRWSFDEAREFICDHFTEFSPRLGTFAARTFDDSWIDAMTRDGKVGGAYCISFPNSRESRVLCNFDGSLSSVLTIAHELGHAYHYEVLKDTPRVARDYPMTLAETASIFCELVALNAALEMSPAEDRQTIAEQFLQDAAQIIVDILSRYRFETAVFAERENNELTPDEFCALMKTAQLETYGEALDPDYLHPYMWAVKGHYYSQDLPYYNFPYAFGMLFGTGLYDRYRSGESNFVERYDQLLSETGSATANEVTKNAGFDIETESFWLDGIKQALKFTESL